MRYKLPGPTGLRVWELSLGTMSFGDAWGFGADPLQPGAQAWVASSVHDPWLVRHLPGLLDQAGFALMRQRSFGYAETSDARYMPTIVDRGADALVAADDLGAEAATALKAEARRRAATGEFFGPHCLRQPGIEEVAAMTRQIGDRAVVLGAGIAGLLAARVLADAYGQVTVIDRDQLPQTPTHRRGIPHGRHLHALAARGQQALEELFPGLTAELVAHGAPAGSLLANARLYLSGHRLRQADTGLVLLCASRPFLEAHVRARVRALPNVTVLDRCDIVGLATTPDGRRAIGARVLRRADNSAEELIAADLVVDASGRGSRTPVWLEELGYARPETEQVRIGLGYATRIYRLPPDALHGDLAVLQAATPQHPRTGALQRLEGDRWMLTLAGILGDHPPTGPDGFLAFARSLQFPDIYEAVRDGEPLDDPVGFRFPASVRHRYERLDRFPDGLLVLGDAVASFNPIYGQGMSVAAVEALVLRRHLERGTEPQPRRWFRDLAHVVDVPWDMSAGGDLVFPGVPGRRTPKVRLISAYLTRLHAAAAHDASLASAFIRVAGLVAPPQTLLRPQVAVRVLRASQHPAAKRHGRLQYRDADDPSKEVPIPSVSESGDSPEAAGSPGFLESEHQPQPEGCAMRKIGGHAVVLGASMAGLLAARVLSDAYERVTVVERDTLPNRPEHRRGVPQGRHAHVLVPRGTQILDKLFPGLLDDLVMAGAPVIGDLEELRFSPVGHRLCLKGSPPQPFVCQVSRPFLEGHVRARVRALPAVEVLDRCQVVGLVTTAARDRVTGVRMLSLGAHAEETLDADLVLDATGRGGRTPAWLATMGYDQPPQEQLTINLKYATRHLRLRPDALPDQKFVTIGAEPGRPSGLVLFAEEQDRWILTVIGYDRHHPPTDPDAFLAFVETIAPPDVLAAIRDAEPLDDIVAYQFPANLRRRYERARRFPRGLLVFGDAICSTNPAYALGMSVAALQAAALQDTLAGGDHDLARRFFRAAAKPINMAWQLTVGSDLALPQVQGPRPLPGRIINAYINRVLTAAEHDPAMAEQFFRVASLQNPVTRLFRLSTARRVLLGNLRRHPEPAIDATPVAISGPRT